MLQAVELVVAVVFVDISVHVARGGLLVVAAIAFAGLAVTARGPLGIIRLCGPRLHLGLVIGTAATVAIAPIVPAFRPDIQGIIVLEFGTIGLIRLATFTRSAETVGRFASPRPGRSVIDATATVVPPGASSRSQPATEARPSRPPTSGTAARWAGRTAGAAAATGKRAAAKHRPVAEARLRRSIRDAGKIAGRVTAPPAKPEPPTE